MKKIEYALVRVLYGIFRIVPLAAGNLLSDGLAFIIRTIVRYRHDIVLENLKYAFPDLNTSEIKRMLPEIYRHFVYLWVELLQSWRLNDRYFDRNFEADGLDELIALVNEGKPVMLVGGHLGNFEWLGYYLRTFIPNLHAFMKRIHNPYINEFVVKNRNQMGIALIYTDDNAFKKGLALLKAGGSLAIVADQDVGERGIYVNFLNRPAATATGTAIYHLRTGIPMFYCTAIRRSFGKFCVFIERVKDQLPGNNKSIDLFVLTQRHTHILEKMVRLYPHQYLWTHRRWKNQPGLMDIESYQQNISEYGNLAL